MIFSKSIYEQYGSQPILIFKDINSNNSFMIFKVGPKYNLYWSYTIWLSWDLRYHLSQFSISSSVDDIIKFLLNIENRFETQEQAEQAILDMIKILGYKFIDESLMPYT